MRWDIKKQTAQSVFKASEKFHFIHFETQKLRLENVSWKAFSFEYSTFVEKASSEKAFKCLKWKVSVKHLLGSFSNSVMLLASRSPPVPSAAK